jgi:hypothetical protein
MASFDPPTDKCIFLWEFYQFPKEIFEQIAAGNISAEKFAGVMSELIETGARNPGGVSMSDWYYMQEHAGECSYCADKFERLARENHSPGPTTLR